MDANATKATAFANSAAFLPHPDKLAGTAFGKCRIAVADPSQSPIRGRSSRESALIRGSGEQTKTLGGFLTVRV